MLSKNQVRFINGLKRKKNRKSEGLFIAEGRKVVNELLDSDFQVHKLYSTPDYCCPEPVQAHQVSEKELKSLSSLSTPNQVLGVFRIPDEKPILREGIALALDEVNDPGNLGTIIRLCDWFDIPQILCSENTVDCFNPKVVQASMGSLSRVRINYVNLSRHLETEPRPVYGTFMEGESLYDTNFEKDCVLVLGNEANGISPEVRSFVTHEVSIPQFGKHPKTESLNVAMAAAVFLSEIRR